jgi:H+/Na+-translocating ferredoxin:NAD+ oxidoreductase subunit B
MGLSRYSMSIYLGLGRLAIEVNPYMRLAEKLNALPNGFPATKDGIELRLLAKLFSPEEATLAASLQPELETAESISARTGAEPEGLRKTLKGMSRRGLINAGKVGNGLGYGLMPFVVGIYEMQVSTIDKELAQLFEDYYLQAFGEILKIKPQFHRVIPVGETVRNSLEIRPFQSAAELVNSAKAWGVLDCICRKQKALIGEPCKHPIDVCMVLDERAGAFDHSNVIRAMDQEEALRTLRRAAEAGLVHSVSNNQQGVHYICNCCTCSCGILRGMSSLGIANVVARSAYVNRVDDAICNGCKDCVELCQFEALSVDGVAMVNEVRCVGCGVCVLVCSTGALGLVLRPEESILATPGTLSEWGAQRLVSRGPADNPI